MNRVFKKIFRLIIVLAPLLTFVGLAQAESVVNFTPMVSIPGSGFLSQQPVIVKNDTSMICDYIIAVYKYAIAIVGILAVLAVAIGGVMWIMAAGNSGMVGQGKEWISSGIIGLVLALGSFILLATINKDLVSCKIISIESLAKINQAKQSGNVYKEEAQKAGTVTKNIDSSGKYKCCVIQGMPFAPPSAPVPTGPNGMYCSGYGDGTKECPSGGMAQGIKRCATYEVADAVKAQQECDNFYTGYNCYDPLLKYNCFFEKTTRESTTLNELWSATVVDGKCWENSQTKDWCKGQ